MKEVGDSGSSGSLAGKGEVRGGRSLASHLTFLTSGLPGSSKYHPKVYPPRHLSPKQREGQKYPYLRDAVCLHILPLQRMRAGHPEATAAPPSLVSKGTG